MIYKVKEVDHDISSPYYSEDAVEPKAGDIIKVTSLNGEELTVICTNDNNTMSGGHKGNTCKHYCSFRMQGHEDYMCVHLPLKCGDYIMFKNIDDVLENL